jgi:hypothetical protein
MKFSGKSLMKLSYNLNPILYNRVVLYFLAFLALVDIVYLLSCNDITSLAILVLVAILTTFFSKNMVVILVIALCITHVFKYGAASYVSEGMENNLDSKDDIPIPPTKPPTKPDDKPPKKPIEPTKPLKPDTKKDADNIEYADLKNEYQDFKGIQDEIMTGLQKIDPLLSRAEAFIDRFENYKAQQKDGFKNN